MSNNFLYKQVNLENDDIIKEYIENIKNQNVDTIILQLCFQNHKSYFKLGIHGTRIMNTLFEYHNSQIKIHHIYRLLDCYKKISMHDYKYDTWINYIRDWLSKNYNQEIEKKLVDYYKLCIIPLKYNNDNNIYKNCIFMYSVCLTNINDTISFFAHNIFTTKLIAHNAFINYNNSINNLSQDDFINLISHIINCPYYNQKYDGSFNKTFMSIYYNYLKIIKSETINNNLVQLIKLFEKIKNPIIVKYCMVLILELYGSSLTIEIINSMLEHNLIGRYGNYCPILDEFLLILNSEPVNCKHRKSHNKIKEYCIYSKAISLKYIPTFDTLDCIIPSITHIIPIYENVLDPIVIDIITRHKIIPNKKILDKVICLQNIILINLILTFDIYPDLNTFNAFIDANDKLIASDCYPVISIIDYLANFKSIVNIILKTTFCNIPLTIDMIIHIFPFYTFQNELPEFLNSNIIQTLCNYYYTKHRLIEPQPIYNYKHNLYSLFANQIIKCTPSNNNISNKKLIHNYHNIKNQILIRKLELCEPLICVIPSSYKNITPLYVVGGLGVRGPTGSPGLNINNTCTCRKCCKAIKYNIVFDKKYVIMANNKRYVTTCKKKVDIQDYNFLVYYKKCIKHNLNKTLCVKN